MLIIQEKSTPLIEITQNYVMLILKELNKLKNLIYAKLGFGKNILFTGKYV